MGPLLFNTYINVIVTIDDREKYVIYADDCSILLSKQGEDALIKNTHEMLQQLVLWQQSNKPKVYTKKTKAVILRARNTPLTLNNVIKYAGEQIEIAHEHKILV